MNIIERFLSVTPKRCKDIGAIFALSASIFGFMAAEFEGETIKWLFGVIGGLSGIISAYYMSRVVKISDVRNMSQENRYKLKDKIQSKKIITRRDNTILAELMNKEK